MFTSNRELKHQSISITTKSCNCLPSVALLPSSIMCTDHRNFYRTTLACQRCHLENQCTKIIWISDCVFSIWAHALLFWRTFKDFETSRGWNTTRRGELFEDMIALRGWAITRGAKLFRAEGFLNGDMNYFLLEYRFRWKVENPSKIPNSEMQEKLAQINS